MKIRLLPAAKADLREAAAWYNERSRGLGRRFRAEVQEAFDRIAEHPQAWAPVDPELRRCLLDRFPYGVIYALQDDVIVVIAVAHNKRHPESWRDRLRLL